MTQKIRTTIEPEVELEVTDAELLDLQRQGLVLDTTATTPAGLAKAATKATATPPAEGEKGAK